MRISLAENPSTGYRWRFRQSRGLLILRQSRFEPAPSSATGAGGNRSFDFICSRKGRTRITFEYCRSWEKQPLRALSFTIEVRP